MKKDFKAQTIAGISWSIIGHIGRQGTTLIVGIILARLLSPEEFGLLAMVTVLTGFADILTELGFGAALIQKKDLKETHLSSVFWLNLIMGILLTLIFILSSGLIATFYQTPIIKIITIALAFNFFINSWSIVQRSILVKKIDFKSLSLIEVSSSLISGIIAIYMAFTGYGVWSLIAKSLVQSFFDTTFFWFFSEWKPRLIFKWNSIKDLLKFSLNLLGDRILNYFTSNADDLLIGKVLGSSPLGLYNRAYVLMQLPMSQFSWVISKVLFPSFSLIQDDKEQIAAIYLKITRIIALFTFPLSIGLLVLASDFVIIVFGEQWEDMISLVRIFSVLGMFKSIATLAGNLFLSQGRSDLQFKIGLFVKPFIIISFVIGLFWGIEGVAIAYTLASLIGIYPEFLYAGRLVNLTWAALLKNLSSILFLSLIMGGIVLLFSMWLNTIITGFAGLLLSILAGILSYWTLIHLFNISAYRELIQIINLNSGSSK